jgi:hypothetical protein
MAQAKPAVASKPSETIAAAKKKANARAKAPKQKSDGPILGGADYVTIAMGGRRKANEEAKKLPISDDDE